MQPRDFGALVQQQLATMPTIKQAGGLAGAGKALGGMLGAAAKASPPAAAAAKAPGPVRAAATTALKGYRTATTPLAVHATKALPESAQPVAKRGAGSKRCGNCWHGVSRLRPSSYGYV